VTGDPAPGQTASAIVHTVLGEVIPGSIVIFHANGRGHGTPEALQQIVPAVRDKGY
jgi:peptidoglycan/xylan/chitin deacetylase (PgdA/CDA1 family)